ncbi:MAG: AAA family ATPase [Burkholderiaceae bacterium]|jgi:hypothetical protein
MYETQSDNQHPYGVTVLYGGSGTGKTTLLARAVAEHCQYAPTVVLDVTHDLRELLVGSQHSPRTLHPNVTVHYYTSLEGYEWSLKQWFMTFSAGDIVFIGPPEKGGDPSESIRLFTAILTSTKHSKRFSVYVCDEAELLFSNNQFSRQYDNAIYTARNRHASIYLAAKRPTRIPTNVRSCAMRAVVFKLRADADARATEELGPSELFRDRVQNLTIGKGLYYCGQGPGEELPILDSRESPIPWLETAPEVYSKRR